ncbi:glycosyltransferase [Ornithinimicrobium sp. F0845]|uniref:glycosyltransferase n=1 Tax=Ornithinimicrobium sp. F0845 TaxID=2926412 RepID=UPI001FF5B7D9|nr:glycosyltransferase [Ornithinimicrobium sp. F0845]MCK0112936.1 glycosyltransferase [Ornithinimicrobium sp. F0845]
MPPHARAPDGLRRATAAGGRVGILASSGPHLDSVFVRVGDLLRSRGHEVHYAAGTPMERAPGVVVTSVTERWQLANLRAGKDLRRWVEEVDADVVLVSTSTAALLARRAALPVPVVYFARGLGFREASPARTAHWELLERWGLPRTSSVITLNDEDEAWFARWAPDLPVHRLPFGVGLPVETFPASPQPDNNVVLWVGGHTPRKRPWLAVQVAAEMRRRGTPIRLRMLGCGPLTAEITRLAGRLGVADDVTVPGYVPVAPELQGARMLLHTADREGLPRVVVEALAVQRPTASFDVKGMRRLPAVELIADGDVPAMADLVAHLLTHPVADGAFPSAEELSDERAVVALETVLTEAVNTTPGGLSERN